MLMKEFITSCFEEPRLTFSLLMRRHGDEGNCAQLGFLTTTELRLTWKSTNGLQRDAVDFNDRSSQRMLLRVTELGLKLGGIKFSV